MNQKIKFQILISYVVAYLLLIGSCSSATSQTQNSVLTFSQTPSGTMTRIPIASATATVTPTLNTKTLIITPDDVFSFPSSEPMNTPSSADFCENIPQPKVIKNADKAFISSGKFSLCIWTTWQYLIDTVMDLDEGTLVSADDINGDIALAMAHQGLDGVTRYYVTGLNNAHIDEIETDNLRRCLKTCQTRNGWANLLDDQITTNLPNRPE